MASNNLLSYLGVLSAPTEQGPRAVAVALTGAVELYHFLDAGLDTSSEAVRDWYWASGINPDNAAMAMPADVLIRDILLPAIGSRMVVIHHGDTNIPFVDELIQALKTNGAFVTISGIDLVGPINSSLQAEAARRAFALQARYEAAIEIASKEPLIHKLSGEIGPNGLLSSIAISGVFSKQKWTLENEDDQLFVLSDISHMGPLAAFTIEPGPAQNILKKLANEYGLNEKLAA